ncbi:TPA: protease IV [Pseudomonas aeruginosa]|nr:protease IV [Pseudomonas aeruginosa]
MRKRTYLNACLVLALAAGASQALAAPGASEMAGDVAVLQASPASTGHARFANPNAAISAAGIHFAAPPARRVARAAPLAPKPGTPLQVGVGLKTVTPEIDLATLEWIDTPDGRHTARFPISAAGAASLRAAIRLETRSGSLPDDVLLHFAGAGKEIFEASGKDLSVNRPYWSPVIEGDTLTVELVLPANLQPGDLRLSVPQVSYFADSLYKAGYRDGFGASGSCEVDAVCATQSGTRAYDNATAAVAKMVFTSSADGGSYICTGTLLNNGNSPKRQLFWSAAHCIEDQATAATLQTIWFYNTTQCYGDASTINQSVTVLTGGANILHRDAKRDTLLLELKRTPPAGVFYQGWSATPIANGSLGHDIHHPRGDAKKYSQGNVSAVGVTYDGHTALTRVDWPSAVVEGGSSGSGLLTVAGDGSYQLRGGLYGGPSYCGAPTSQRNDYFSDFSGVYSQISRYFAP